MPDRTTKQDNGVIEIPALNSIEAAHIDEKIKKYQAQLKVLTGDEQNLRTQMQQLDAQLNENSAMQQRHVGAITILEELKDDLSGMNEKVADDGNFPEDAERV